MKEDRLPYNKLTSPEPEKSKGSLHFAIHFGEGRRERAVLICSQRAFVNHTEYRADAGLWGL